MSLDKIISQTAASVIATAADVYWQHRLDSTRVCPDLRVFSAVTHHAGHATTCILNNQIYRLLRGAKNELTSY